MEFNSMKIDQYTLIEQSVETAIPKTFYVTPKVDTL